MLEVAEKLGATANSYRVLVKLAVGGMAEIFLVRGVTVTGVERYCVLKRVLPERAGDLRFVQMFLDEARLATLLQHPNIASVYDIGMLDDLYFYTMEYVHGETVRLLLQKAHELQRPVPLACVLTIIAGAAAGLHHAHERNANDGRPLGIVHRDVSPSNLMVSYEGNVKLVDFGVAKASDRALETKSGTVKGKISYLSPEQCRGERVDRRSDLFSLGIVMWEMLTGARLYRRTTDFETMAAIVTEDPPRPSCRRPEIPAVIDAIVLRLLSKSVADRFQTAAEVVEAIENASVRGGTVLSTAAVGRLMHDLFGLRPEPWRELERDRRAGDAITLVSRPIPRQLAAAIVRASDPEPASAAISSASNPSWGTTLECLPGPMEPPGGSSPPVTGDAEPATLSVEVSESISGDIPGSGTPLVARAAPASEDRAPASGHEASAIPEVLLDQHESRVIASASLPVSSARANANPELAVAYRIAEVSRAPRSARVLAEVPTLRLPSSIPVAVPSAAAPRERSRGALLRLWSRAHRTTRLVTATAGVALFFAIAIAVGLSGRAHPLEAETRGELAVEAIAHARPVMHAAPEEPPGEIARGSGSATTEIGRSPAPVVAAGSGSAAPVELAAEPVSSGSGTRLRQRPPGGRGSGARHEPRVPDAIAVVIDSDPPGARVIADGRVLGKTPFLGKLPRRDREVTLVIRIAGYADRTIVARTTRAISERVTLARNAPPRSSELDRDEGVNPF